MAALELRVLGEFEARDATGLPLEVRAKKNRALLAALALAPACSMPRVRIANLLWSDRGEIQAQSNLRQALVALRSDLAAIDPSPLSADRDRLMLNAKHVEVDAIVFDRLAASEDVTALRRAASLYRGGLLSDIYIIDPAFDDWLAVERGRLADCARQVLEKLCARETGAERIHFAERLVALDPLREASQRILMQVHFEAGDKALALRQYEACRVLLRDELRVTPDAHTEALYQDILHRRSPGKSKLVESGISIATSNARAAAVNDKPSVGVLPLVAITADSELNVFCDGLTDDIITGLSRISSVKVIARNTMLTYKNRAVDVRSVGRELGVQYVIEGSVRSSDTRIRVSAQLTEAATGHHIWTQQIDRIRTEMLDVQDDIMKSIVASVQTQLILAEGRKSTTRNRQTEEEASYLLARAWQRFLGLTEQSLADCAALARRALQFDDESGLANRILAITLYHQVYMGFIPFSKALLDRLYVHAQAAIESDDVDEYCHWAMCCAHLLKKEHALAIASLRRGLKINPNCSLLHGSMGTVLAWSGEPDSSIASNELALRMNPQDPANFFRHFGLAVAHYLAGRYDEALVQAMEVIETRPSWWLAQLIFCATLSQLGRHDEAGQAMEQVKRMRPGVNASTLGILPFARASDREHLLDGLHKAGLAT